MGLSLSAKLLFTCKLLTKIAIDIQHLLAYQRSPHWLVDLQHGLLYHVQVYTSKGQCDASTENGVARKHGSYKGVIMITEDNSSIDEYGSINGHYHECRGEVSC